MITDIHVQNYRSYIDESFEFDNGVTIIVGPNASGKTNLLEAILMLTKGTSYRLKESADLIAFKQPWARLDGHTASNTTRTVKILRDPKPEKQYEIDGKTYKRLPLQQTIPTVLFEPNHLILLGGGPDKRRDYLDDLLEQTTPGYGTILRKYKRTVSQRNALLKQPKSPQYTHVFPWDVRLSQLAGQIVQARQQVINTIAASVEELYSELSKASTKVVVTYKTAWPADGYETRLLKTLETTYHDDVQKGFTSTGPHRDDLQVFFNGHIASETASRGEVRTVLLTLKITELRIVEAARQQTPILLLDDVFSELDGSRRHALTDYLAQYQTFITTTDADLATKHFAQNCTVIPLG